MGNHLTIEWGNTPKFGEDLYFVVRQTGTFAELQCLSYACTLRVIWSM